MEELKDGCVAPARGPIGVPEVETASPASDQEEKRKMTAQVGKPAPDFEANAFFEGGFKNVRFSDYKDQWVILCFYPGDFTFV